MSVTATPPAKYEHIHGLVAKVVREELHGLQPALRADKPGAVGKAARLRRGAGKDPLTTPDLWGLIDFVPLFGDDARMWQTNVERAQRAVYGALTLWALHQQSKGEDMHEDRGNNVGAAVRRLMPSGEIDDQLRKRLVRAAAAPNFAQLLVRLRGIVQLLRQKGVAMDYAELASQLYRWQQPGGAAAVRREWGRGFHASRPAQQPNGDSTSAAEPNKETA